MMTHEKHHLVAFFRKTTLVPPYDHEDVMVGDLRFRDDLLRSLIMPCFKLDIEARISILKDHVLTEIFTPMSLAEYCFRNVLSVKAFVSEAHFFFYADETGVLLNAKDGSMRTRVVDVFDTNTDWSTYTVARQPLGEVNPFHVFDNDFELPPDVEVLADVSMPLSTWWADNLSIAEEYILTVRRASCLAMEHGTCSPSVVESVAETVSVCEKCETALPAARAELKTMFPAE